MPRFQLRLDEYTTERSSAVFSVVAERPDAAAAAITSAYDRARRAGASVVQPSTAEPQVLQWDRTIALLIACVLLDGSGNPLGIVTSVRVPLDDGANGCSIQHSAD